MSKRKLVDTFLDRLASVAMIVAAVALVWVVVDRRSEPSGVSPVERFDAEAFVDHPPTVGVQGNPDARIVVMEFSDFECPYCGQYARDIYPQLVTDYVDTGQARYVFRHFPLESTHRQAAEAVECAAESGQYWQMRDRLFEVTRTLTQHALVTAATSIGLDPASFEACLESGVMADRVVADREYGTQMGVISTPTFVVAEAQADGTLRLIAKLVGLQPYAMFASILEEALSSGE